MFQIEPPILSALDGVFRALEFNLYTLLHQGVSLAVKQTALESHSCVSLQVFFGKRRRRATEYDILGFTLLLSSFTVAALQ